MLKVEKRLVAFLEKNILLLFVLFCTLLGMVIRISLRNIISGDYTIYLQPWYEEIKSKGLSEQVGNYNLLYQFIIWILTKTPLPSLFAYKIVSCIFDWFLAIITGAVIYNITEDNKKIKAMIGYCLVWMSPIVCLNSAAWAQCDSIYVTFGVLSILLLDKDMEFWAFVALGASFAFKLQAVFVVPLFLLAYVIKKRFSILNFFIIPIVMILTALPTILLGHRSIAEVFSVYLDQTGYYQMMVLRYPSIWLLLCQSDNPVQYANLKIFAILIAVFVLATFMVMWIKNKYPMNGRALYMIAFILVYTCVLFLPAMHERYGYMVEILAIVLAILEIRTMPLCIGLICLSLNTYGRGLFEITTNWQVLAVINLAIYILYVTYIFKSMQNFKSENISNKEV